jgi:hypothetical protein
MGAERKKLSDFGYNRFSQFGEDGIVEKIFEHIGIASRVCVEFGAWDGLHLSNTASLWQNGWRAVLIEADKNRFRLLMRNASRHDCLCINAYVGLGETDSLEAILATHNFAADVDLLSIDIDGDDYHVFASLRRLLPRVVICEYNPTIPAGLDVAPQPGAGLGCSAAALQRLGREHGYELVAMTDSNCFFVLRDLFRRFSDYETRLEKLRVDTHLVHLLTSYSGEYVALGHPPYGISGPYRRPLDTSEPVVYFPPNQLGTLWRRLRRLALLLFRH